MASAGWLAAAQIGGSLLSSRNNRRAQSDAQDALSDSEAAALEYQRQAAEEARNAAIPLYQQAQDNSQMGTQAALDVYSNIVPQQLNAFRQGNEQAQNALYAGLAQQQNAILGNPISNDAFMSPRGIGQIDTSVFNQQLPQFGRIEDALGGQYGQTDVPHTVVNPDTFMGSVFGGGFSDNPTFMNSFNNPAYMGIPEPLGMYGAQLGGIGGNGQPFSNGQGGFQDFQFQQRRDDPFQPLLVDNFGSLEG